jgi:hypothetical protein
VARLACWACAAWLCLAAAPAASQSLPVGAPSVVAWGLATGAERLARLHAQVAQDVLPARSRRAMAECLRDLDSGARQALSRATEADTREALQLYLLVLGDTRAAALRSATREQSRKVLERAEELAWVAGRAARGLQSSSLTAALPAAGSLAQVALLSQRLARERLYERWEPRTGAQASATRSELDREMRELQASLASDPEASSELQLADNQLQFLSELPKGRLGTREAETTAKAADRVLESLVRLSRRLQPASVPAR